MSACKSENAKTRSGSSATIFSKLALMNAETFGFLRASGGRTGYPDTPAIKPPASRRYSVSVVSSVRQTMRCGYADTSFCMLRRSTAGAILVRKDVGIDGECSDGADAGRAARG